MNALCVNLIQNLGIDQVQGWRHTEGEHRLAWNSAVIWTFFQTAGYISAPPTRVIGLFAYSICGAYDHC